MAESPETLDVEKPGAGALENDNLRNFSGAGIDSHLVDAPPCASDSARQTGIMNPGCLYDQRPDLRVGKSFTAETNPLRGRCVAGSKRQTESAEENQRTERNGHGGREKEK